jgi:GNAT superfamily N-acetyltransferase
VIDAAYEEHAVLRDGSRVTIRPVRPSDKELLRRGFERLSPESRFRRFLSPKSTLSDAELAYLTELDGVDHFALGAIDEAGAGLGIARFVRTQADPTVAEVAVAVVDDWHGRGLGTLLLVRLAAAARERGIERFAGQALASNLTIQDMIAQIHGVVRPTDGPEVALNVDLAQVPVELAGPPGSPLRHVWELIARGLLLVRHAFSRE